jgi:polysaccharide pyruvyl transferase CsaB
MVRTLGYPRIPAAAMRPTNQFIRTGSKGVARLQAVLCGYYGFGNGGDEALLATLLQMLPEQVTPVVLSGNPAQTAQLHGVRTCDRNQPGRVLNLLRQSDAFIWGGGSLIQDATSAISPLYYTGLMLVAQWLGLKTIAWGQGVGPLKRSTTRWLARRTFQGCTAVSVRDRASAALLADWRISGLIAPDPVWALASKPVIGLWDLPAPRVAVALRAHSQLTPERLAVLTQGLIDFQKATRACILLIPFQGVQDRGIAEAIRPQLPGSSQILQLDHPQELKGVFRGVDMAIAMRLHALIMAAAEGCRCFALSYDPKVDQLMGELEIPGWQLSQLPKDPNTIGHTWLEHYANGEPLSSDRISALLDRALAHRDLLHQVLA